MEIFKTIFLSVALILATSVMSHAQSGDAIQKIKTYVNKVVQKVENTEEPEQKRAILNESFDDMVDAFERVESMTRISAKDKEGSPH